MLRAAIVSLAIFASIGAPAHRAHADDPAAPAPTTAPTTAPTPPPTTAPTAPPRRRDATLAEIAAGPFHSSRLFAMPVADVVGAYQLTLSGDGSLLQETGILSAAGVLAIGFGDIAQLEYRHTAAISVENTSAPIPAVGVQLEIPLRERTYVPAFAVAFRLGVPRDERFGATTVEESVTDLYLVGRLHLWGPLRPLTLHGGVRISSARITVGGDQDFETARAVVLPAGGWEVATSDDTRLVGELALVPRFEFDPEAPAPPRIASGLLGRLGVRWYVHPAFSIDSSLGYQLEVPGAENPDGPSAVVQWDIRLGAEIFVPWGSLVCRAAGVFCE